MNKKELAISIQAFDHLNIEQEIKDIYKSGIRSLHIDIMDYEFANNFAFGPDTISKICEKFGTKLSLNIHFMIVNPIEVTKLIIEKNKPNEIIIDIESLSIDDHIKLIKYGHSLGVKMGVGIQLKSNLEKYKKIFELVDFIMMMAVPIGKAGQKFDENIFKKTEWIKSNVDIKNKKLGIDGGVRLSNIKKIYDAGFNYIVLGSAYKGEENYAKITKKFLYSNYR